ncbi:MAG: hypothetical protein ACE5HN_04960, partial [Nitrospiria bacterium]
MKRGSYLLLALIVFISFLNLVGCSDTSVTDAVPTGTGPASGTTGGTTITTSSPPATITLAVAPAGVSSLGTATVTATVTDSTTANVPDGTTVTFNVDSTTLGSITPTATTVSGIATATFTAKSLAGISVVTATAGTVSATTSIVISGVDVGSIEFVSATPNVVGVKGSGQTETSDITFSVKDINGQPAIDGTTVSFTLDGPKGGESLSASSASTVAGLAKVTLQSGSVAGPVRVTASTIVNTVIISSLSTGVSIGGGTPNETHFTLSRSTQNLAGLAVVNLQSTVSAFLADRFGNFNVLQGTSISFYTEAGAIDRNNVTDAVGSTSVIFRTQNPIPVPAIPSPPVAPPGIVLTGNTRDGLSTIIATTRGEECFVDDNGNGTFDGTLTDTFPPACDLSEPFIDADDDGVFDPTTEFFVDADQDGTFDPPNGVWDSNIMIWERTSIVFTGGPDQMVVTPTTFTIGDGEDQSFDFCVADVNANAIMGGSTVEVVASSGTLSNGGPLTIPDILLGPFCMAFNLADSSSGDTDPALST